MLRIPESHVFLVAFLNGTFASTSVRSRDSFCLEALDKGSSWIVSLSFPGLPFVILFHFSFFSIWLIFYSAKSEPHAEKMPSAISLFANCTSGLLSIGDTRVIAHTFKKIIIGTVDLLLSLDSLVFMRVSIVLPIQDVICLRRKLYRATLDNCNLVKAVHRHSVLVYVRICVLYQ